MTQRWITYRNQLHQLAETGCHLPQTEQYLIHHLPRQANIIPVENAGLLVLFDYGKPQTVAFRADCDALPIAEPPRLYASLNPSTMHACGHDGHMAMLLELSHQLLIWKDLTCNVALIFEYGEETHSHADALLDHPWFADHPICEIYGIHIWPYLPQGTFAAKAGCMMAQSKELHVTIHGKQAHLSRLQDGLDALETAQAWIAQTLDYCPDIRLRYGHIEGGSACNILADSIRIDGSIRSLTNTGMEKALAYLHTLQTLLEMRYHTAIDLTFGEGYPMVINHPDLYRKLLQLEPAIELLAGPVYASDSFGIYTQRLNGCYLFLGTGNQLPLHNPDFDFDPSLLKKGIDLYMKILQSKRAVDVEEWF